MSDHAAFEQRFGAALAGRLAPDDAILVRALAVHRNTATRAAIDALDANYPVLRALAGDEPFAACARAYLEAHPPVDPRLCVYGADMAMFIAGYAPFGGMTWLADIATLEWLCIEALFAADAPMLDGAAIAAGLDPSASLRLHPATRFADLASPAAAIWRAHRDGPPTDDALAAIAWRPTGTVVTRPDDQLIVTELDSGGIAFLTACAAGRPLTQAAEVAAAAGAEIEALFSVLITAGAFA